ncbi:MAG TPA: hypothetical protein VNI84_13815 [Pyrinomonadaceae bacterium]|nr:hypothetical protein [Pyrinomonadaceae bacterium]
MPIKYDRKTARYRTAGGRFVSPREVRKTIDKTFETVKKDMRVLGEALTTGGIDLRTFQTLMREQLKISHSLAASIGRGGRRQMSLSDWGKVGGGLKKQYAYLNKLSAQIEKGLVSDVQIINRAAAYSHGVRLAYYGMTTIAETAGDATVCRRIIQSKEGCKECAYYASLGFIPIDEMPEVGSLICGVFCLCEIQFR